MTPMRLVRGIRFMFSKPDNMNRRNASLTFLLITLITGLSFVSCYGPLSGPDPDMHSYATYAISTGQIGTNIRKLDDGRGNMVRFQFVTAPTAFTQAPMDNRTIADVLKPLNAYNAQRDAQNASLAHGSQTLLETKQTRANQYTPLSYLPQAAGMSFGRLVGKSLWGQFQAARLANLMTYLLLGWLAVWWARRACWLMVVALAHPTIVFLAASLSADSLTNILAALVIAVAIRMGEWVEPGPLLQGLFVAGVALLGPLKLCYLPLSLLALVLPVFTWRRRILLTILPWLIGLPIMGWFMLNYNKSNALYNIGDSVNHLLNHPIHDGMRLINSVWVAVWRAFADNPLMTVTLIILLAVFVANLHGMQISRPRAWISLIAALLCVTATLGTLLLSWTEMNQPWGVIIAGFQERYLLPLLPLFAFTLTPVKPLTEGTRS